MQTGNLGILLQGFSWGRVVISGDACQGGSSVEKREGKDFCNWLYGKRYKAEKRRKKWV